MIKDLKNEMNSFLDELEKTVKDETQLLHMKEVTEKLFSVFIDELEHALTYKEDEINELAKKQEETMERMDEMDGKNR